MSKPRKPSKHFYTRTKTWKVLVWDRPAGVKDGEPIPLLCQCGRDAECPTCGYPGASVIATFGLRVVFEPAGHIPPKHWMPQEIQCRKCRRVYFSVEAPNVR